MNMQVLIPLFGSTVSAHLIHKPSPSSGVLSPTALSPSPFPCRHPTPWSSDSMQLSSWGWYSCHCLCWTPLPVSAWSAVFLSSLGIYSAVTFSRVFPWVPYLKLETTPCHTLYCPFLLCFSQSDILKY